MCVFLALHEVADAAISTAVQQALLLLQARNSYCQLAQVKLLSPFVLERQNLLIRKLAPAAPVTTGRQGSDRAGLRAEAAERTVLPRKGLLLATGVEGVEVCGVLPPVDETLFRKRLPTLPSLPSPLL